MEDTAKDSVGGHVAIALAAGALATKEAPVAPAIRDRHQALKRAIWRKRKDIALGELEEAPLSEAHRASVAKALDEHGASKDRDVVMTASEVLGLIKVDDDARTAVETMLADVETALVALAEAEVDEGPAAPDVVPVTTSRRHLPPDAPSRTELERLALPIWKRTDRFFMKVGIVAAIHVVLGVVAWLALRTTPEEVLAHCRDGDQERCWQVVAAEDTVEHGQKVSAEPLRLLCDKHQDACACAGLAYVRAADADRSVDCTGLEQATVLDPKWACSCKRYDFWRWGQKRLAHCGVPRCE